MSLNKGETKLVIATLKARIKQLEQYIKNSERRLDKTNPYKSYAESHIERLEKEKTQLIKIIQKVNL